MKSFLTDAHFLAYVLVPLLLASLGWAAHTTTRVSVLEANEENLTATVTEIRSDVKELLRRSAGD